jgi:glutathione S-transferase
MNQLAMTTTDTLELWQTEWCPASHRVRQRLTELGLTYTIHQVPVRAQDRVQLRERTSETSIPVLVADGQPVEGETAIVSYLDGHFPEPPDAHQQRDKAAMAKGKQLERECPQLTAATA